jgi:hypothetical protein
MSDFYKYLAQDAQHGVSTVNDADGVPGGGGDSSAWMATGGGGNAGRGNRGSGGNGANRWDPLLDNGNLNKKAVKHGSYTYYVAPRPAANADRETKSRVLEDAITTVRNGEGTYQAKLSFLTQYFQLPVIETAAKGKVGNLKNVQGPCFIWTFRGYEGSDLTDQDVGVGPGLQADIRYARFDVQLNPAPGMAGVQTSNAPLTTVANRVLIRLQLRADGTAPHASYTVANADTFAGIAAVDQTLISETLIFVYDSRNDRVDAEKWDEWIKTTFYHGAFEAAVEMIRETFVGKGVFQSANQRLQTLRQRFTEGGKTKILTVAQFYEKFLSVVNELNPNQSYPVLAAPFIAGLEERIRDYVMSQGYEIPMAQKAFNFEELDELNTAKDRAVKAEQALGTMIDAARLVNNNRGATPTGAFMSQPSTPVFLAHGLGTPTRGEDTRTYDQRYISQSNSFASHSPVETGQTYEVSAFLTSAYLTEYDGLGDYVDMIDKAESTFLKCQAFLSSAELALRRASGTTSPLTCWGCGGLHRFVQCPKKNEPDIRRVANEKMREKFGDRRGNGGPKRDSTALMAPTDFYTSHEMTGAWKELGFKTKKEAQAVVFLASKKTHAKDRKKFLVIDNRTQSDAANDVHVPAFLSFPDIGALSIKAFQSVPIVGSDLSVTRFLPHVNIPIGKRDLSFTLKVAVDSCAGISLGDLSFHMALKNLYPEAVAQFVDLSAAGHTIHVGGVEEGARGITITHVITYYLPALFKGSPARLAFGLAENLATSALVGVGLLTATNAVVSFAGKDPELYLQAIQLNLPMTFEAPTLRDPPIRKDAAAAYLAKQNWTESSFPYGPWLPNDEFKTVDFAAGYYQSPLDEDQA